MMFDVNDFFWLSSFPCNSLFACVHNTLRWELAARHVNFTIKDSMDGDALDSEALLDHIETSRATTVSQALRLYTGKGRDV